jgi:hypothetical protein
MMSTTAVGAVMPGKGSTAWGLYLRLHALRHVAPRKRYERAGIGMSSQYD